MLTSPKTGYCNGPNRDVETLHHRPVAGRGLGGTGPAGATSGRRCEKGAGRRRRCPCRLPGSRSLGTGVRRSSVRNWVSAGRAEAAAGRAAALSRGHSDRSQFRSCEAPAGSVALDRRRGRTRDRGIEGRGSSPAKRAHISHSSGPGAVRIKAPRGGRGPLSRGYPTKRYGRSALEPARIGMAAVWRYDRGVEGLCGGGPFSSRQCRLPQ